MSILAAFALLAAGASGLLAVASLGGAFSERLDVLTHFTPFYCLGGLIGLGLALVARPAHGWREAAVMAAVAVAASAALLAPELAAAALAPRSAPRAQTVKLVQFNVWSENADPERTVRWILAQDADVVVIEEATGEGTAVADRLGRAFPFATRCQPRPTCTTIVFSKMQPAASGVFVSPDLDPLHSGAWARFGAGPSAFTVVGTHLTWPFPSEEQQRQADALAGHLDGLDRSSLILAGDFNSTPWSFALRRLGHRLDLIRRTHAIFTWPARAYGQTHRLESPFPLLPIDQVFAGKSWRTVSVSRGPRLGSDHYPVVVVLTR